MWFYVKQVVEWTASSIKEVKVFTPNIKLPYIAFKKVAETHLPSSINEAALLSPLTSNEDFRILPAYNSYLLVGY